MDIKDKPLNLEGKTILGIDYGQKVIGLAYIVVGREPFPMPRGRIIVKSTEQVFNDIQEICEEEFIDAIVLGIPYLTDGGETRMGAEIEKFSQKLTLILDNIPIYHQDETLSSFEAQERMKNSPSFNFSVDMKRIDEVAACIILEDFLNVQLAGQSL